jgi:ubiquinone/menaquinone biosynthesis C-methylase UbiE
MLLNRILEAETVQSHSEASEYDAMDHSGVNAQFVKDMIASGPLGQDCLDIGTGTALIPIELCRNDPVVRVMAMDASREMLELARYRLEVGGLMHRVQLAQGDAKKLIFQKDYFDTVFSNSLVHHLPTLETFFPEALRVLRTGGLLFVRDLVRPHDQEALDALVEQYAKHESESARQMFRDSLHAALSLDEVKNLAVEAGLDSSCVSMTSDRHWTLTARKIDSSNTQQE